MVLLMRCSAGSPGQRSYTQTKAEEVSGDSPLLTSSYREDTYTTAYHSQTDGLVERLNRTLLSMLAMCFDDHSQ